MLKTGLYEQVINNKINREIANLPEEEFISQKKVIDEAESSVVLSEYVVDVVNKGLSNIAEGNGRLDRQLILVNKIIKTVTEEMDKSLYNDLAVHEDAKQLLALIGRKNNLSAVNKDFAILRPETSIAQSSLFTGAVHEPQMFSELKKEILSCNRIDMLVSFIKWSGLRLIIDELREFTQNGGKLRIITTSYMGATDIKAIEELHKLTNTTIKVSYDTKLTRLHAKAYVFYRDTGFTTAYVGSSNMSNAALSSGLEWNVKLTQKDLAQTLGKINATFESYWNSRDFELYEDSKKSRLSDALKSEKYIGLGDEGNVLFDIRPYSYQQEILDSLEAERTVRGNNKNLVVAATGTGKTVISAFDYKNFKTKQGGKTARLLFIAHREEILKKSMYTFRQILRDNNFGDLFVGANRPEGIDHLFMSIQTFNSQDITSKTTQDFYDYIIVDEFHHAAASTYQKLLEYYNPKILLGLTATPERMDGKNIFQYFNNRIAAEIRLPEAIDRKLLCPFQYFGVTDDVDLSDLKWARGGYEVKSLENVFVFSHEIAKKRAKDIALAVDRYVSDIDTVKGLGFCASVKHAEFMGDMFNSFGIPSMCLTGATKDVDRNDAMRRLTSGEVKFIFVVDIYNEGVDIPEVNTVLFLRPTESLTVFLQQLGRGLRLSENKECLTVLDFIGAANKKYNFENKFAALLMDDSRGVSHEIKNNFISLPKGCYVHLEKKARQYILNNIAAAQGIKSMLVARIASFETDTGRVLSLANFLGYYQMDVKKIYKNYTFSELCLAAGVRPPADEENSYVLKKAMARFCIIDSRRFIKFTIEVLQGRKRIFTPIEKRMLQMIQFTIWQKSHEECGFASIMQGISKVRANSVLCAELVELLLYRYSKIDFIDEKVELGFNCPLDLHCTYTRDQILVALDFMKPATVREGVKYLPDKKVDIFFVTLNKADKDYSPTTMYDDYSINSELFHWQSQSTTSEASPTGKRYINHKAMGNKILLFVREFKKDRILGGAEAYTFLGTASYVTHIGSSPMSITWKLDRPIPAKYLKKTNKLVVV